MAVLSREDFFSHLHETLGDSTTEESMQFLEDMTDTYNDLEQKANGTGIDWEKKYHELNEAWKEKYKRRFFSSGGHSAIPDDSKNEENDDVVNRAKTITIKDLFTNL